jgi:cyclopropane-fatty-acyl-phospholipid synthase
MSESDSALSSRSEAIGGGSFASALTARMWRRAFAARAGRIRHGRLTVSDSIGSFAVGGGSPEAFVRVSDLSTYRDIALGGTIGAAEAYMQGKWTTPELTTLIRVFVANREALEGLEKGFASARRALLWLAHRLHRNTRLQSRRNIHAHYDLGNELYRLFLDPTLTYSAAVYPREDSTLEEAAVYKMDLICRRLHLGPQDHLLEIGTGWGGLALHAARHYGCRVTTTTISQQQRELALERVRAAGLGHRVSVLDCDYRDLDGEYDKLVSVEMVEAVGHEFLDEYFRVCSARLRPHGRMLLQGIVIADRFYEQARRSVDFIQKYIFPGGALPSLGAMQNAIARVTDLQLVHVHDIGMHYARTLGEWRRRFMSQLHAVRQLGYPEEFIRMWEYYLAYCEGGFLERAISDVQVVLDKPGCQLPAVS